MQLNYADSSYQKCKAHATRVRAKLALQNMHTPCLLVWLCLHHPATILSSGSWVKLPFTCSNISRTWSHGYGKSYAIIVIIHPILHHLLLLEAMQYSLEPTTDVPQHHAYIATWAALRETYFLLSMIWTYASSQSLCLLRHLVSSILFPKIHSLPDGLLCLSKMWERYTLKSHSFTLLVSFQIRWSGAPLMY